MKAHLMYADRDFDMRAAPPQNAAELTQDLELDALFDAMADGDAFLREVAKSAVLASLTEPGEIVYRQRVLADCLEHPELVRELYGIALEALARETRIWGGLLSRYPELTLHRSVELLQLFMELLRQLRQFADAHHETFRSDGLTNLCAMLSRELSDEYLSAVEAHLRRLAFREGLLLSAELGPANKGVNYVLHKPIEKQPSWRERLQDWMEKLAARDPAAFVYQIADRDEAGFAALSELRTRGISAVAGTLGQSADHVLGFFTMLRRELAFYIACLNLSNHLDQKGEPTCLPEPLPRGKAMLMGRGIYDVSLSLRMQERVVGNDLHANGKLIVMITGANRGGKSTFLRAVGQAQLMMQCGLFVPAGSFRANLCDGLFTHYKREEDPTMRSGKLDEELGRMSAIVDRLAPSSIVLLNESFAATNEREGSEIARQVVRALTESGVKVLYVTHLFDLARGLYLAGLETALFMRAERGEGGERTFRLIEGEPLPTSHGEDLYRRIFGASPAAAERSDPALRS